MTGIASHGAITLLTSSHVLGVCLHKLLKIDQRESSQSHAPVMGRLITNDSCLTLPKVSIHAPVMGRHQDHLTLQDEFDELKTHAEENLAEIKKYYEGIINQMSASFKTATESNAIYLTNFVKQNGDIEVDSTPDDAGETLLEPTEPDFDKCMTTTGGLRGKRNR